VGSEIHWQFEVEGGLIPELSQDPLFLAEAVRALQYDARGRLGRLLPALKQRRRQARRCGRPSPR
jgi:hypothetical protein